MALLDYLLGGAAGGFQGYEAKKASDLKAKQDEEERQMRLASLFSQGFEPVADVQRKKQDATDAARSLAVAAMNSTRGAGMSLPSAAGQQSLTQGYATAKPERAISYGGQQLALRETASEREDRLSRGEEMRKRQSATDAQRAKDERTRSLVSAATGKPRNSIEAALLAAENSDAYKALFPEPRRTDPLDAIRLEQFKSDREQREAEGMAYLSANARNPSVMRAYGAAFGRNAKMSPGQIGYSLMQQALKSATEGQRAASANVSNARAENLGNDGIFGGALGPTLSKEQRWDALRARPENKSLSDAAITEMVERGMQ